MNIIDRKYSQSSELHLNEGITAKRSHALDFIERARKEAKLPISAMLIPRAFAFRYILLLTISAVPLYA